MFKNCILISCGDTLGIGYELALKILKVYDFNKLNIIPILIGNSSYLKFLSKVYQYNFSFLSINSEIIANIKDLNIPKDKYLVVDILNKITHFKQIQKFSGKISFLTLQKLSEIINLFIQSKIKFAVLTMPVSKKRIQQQNKIKFLGHTEYFAEKFNVDKDYISMLMLGKNKENPKITYKVLILTRHIPLKDVSKNLKVKNMLQQISNTIYFILKNERFRKVELLICGVNPHIGEDGKLGNEEKTKITKVKELLQKKIKNIKITAPILTEEAFKYASQKNNALIACCYHDQAMIPLKLLCGYNIVNVTVGLPFLRVSPGHGTAENLILRNKVDDSAVKFCIEKIIDYFKWKI